MSWSLGRPDGQHLTREELLSRVEGIVRVTDLPVSVDIEEGYSDSPTEVTTLVDSLLDLGVGGLNIEDGEGPVELLEEKIGAVVRRAEERGAPLFVNARTDVYLKDLVPAVRQADEAVQRARRYVETGCSGVFVPGVLKPDEIEQIARDVRVPLNVMAVPGLPPMDELAHLGVQRLSLGPWLSQIAYGAVDRTTRRALQAGHDSLLFSEAAEFAELDGSLST